MLYQTSRSRTHTSKGTVSSSSKKNSKSIKPSWLLKTRCTTSLTRKASYNLLVLAMKLTIIRWKIFKALGRHQLEFRRTQKTLIIMNSLRERRTTVWNQSYSIKTACSRSRLRLTRYARWFPKNTQLSVTIVLSTSLQKVIKSNR